MCSCSRAGPPSASAADAAFPVWVGHLAPGDALVLCTDGVTEAFDAAGTAFGLERFRSVVASTGPTGRHPGALPGGSRSHRAILRAGAPRDDMAVVAAPVPAARHHGRHGADEAWRLSVASEPDALAPALRAVEGILRAREVPPAMIHDCALARRSCSSTSMTHAYGGQSGRHGARRGPRCRRRRSGSGSRTRGPPFNPLEAPEPDLEAPLAERPIGKLGLVLVKHLADRWEYAREGAANVHTLHWRRPAEAGEGAPFEIATLSAQGGIMSLDIETGSGPVERRVTLRGRLDSLTAPKLDAELASILGTPAVTSLVFQLEGLDYISSAGIRSILRARKTLEGRGGHVAIVNAQPAVLKVFEIVKALPNDQVFASQAELDAYLERMQHRARRPG